MKKQEQQERIVEAIVSVLACPKEDVQPKCHLVNDLNADSLDRVEIVMAVEDQFELNIPDEDAEKLETVQQIITYIDTRISQRTHG